MNRFFNTAGPCDPSRHYMLPAEGRLVGVERLLDELAYFCRPRATPDRQADA